MIVTHLPIESDAFVKESRSGNHCPATLSNNKELDFSRYVYRECSRIEFGTIHGATVPVPVWGIIVLTITTQRTIRTCMSTNKCG